MQIVIATHNPHKRKELLDVAVTFRSRSRSEEASEARDTAHRDLKVTTTTIEFLTLDDIHPPIGEIEETGSTLEENALIKARAVHEKTKLPTIADDTGLEVAALGGAPGVFSARYAGENATYADNVNKLLDALRGEANRRAKFSTVIAYIDASGAEQLYRGEVKGTITESPRGTNGFGYDPIFAPNEDPAARTFAEMTDAEKNAISHRGRALRAFARAL